MEATAGVGVRPRSGGVELLAGEGARPSVEGSGFSLSFPVVATLVATWWPPCEDMGTDGGLMGGVAEKDGVITRDLISGKEGLGDGGDSEASAAGLSGALAGAGGATVGRDLTAGGGIVTLGVFMPSYPMTGVVKAFLEEELHLVIMAVVVRILPSHPEDPPQKQRKEHPEKNRHEHDYPLLLLMTDHKAEPSSRDILTASIQSRGICPPDLAASAPRKAS